VTTDRAPAYLRVLDELLPAALHVVEQHVNYPIDTDHGRLEVWASVDARPEIAPAALQRRVLAKWIR
jgi:hypothetical protein